MNRKVLVPAGVLLAVVLVNPPSWAVPLVVQFQGRLTSAAGQPVTNPALPMMFRIFDAETDGNMLWEEEQTVGVERGVYSVGLGAGTPSHGAVGPELFSLDDVWLEVVIVGEPLSPRMQVTSVAYAMQAETADTLDGLDSTEFADEDHTHPFGEITGLIQTSQIPASITRDTELSAHAGNASAHHVKTTSFKELTDQAADAQIPAGIARDAELVWGNLGGIPAGFADGVDEVGLTSESDPQVGTNSANYVPKWNGSALVTGSIYDNGNVGIGTTDPAEDLEVAGTILLSGDHSGKLRLGRYSPSSLNAYLATTSDTEQLRLQIADSTKVAIDTSGYVGIGTTAPETKLQISGNGTSWREGFLAIKNTNEDAGIRLYDSAANVRHHVFNDNDAGDTLRLAPAGSYTSGGITISQTGRVGIGTTTPDNELDVAGTVRAEEVIVDTGWADYVFKEDYARLDLKQVETHIKQKGHLPGIPTAAEVEKNGIGLGGFQVKLLEKVEELTLYLIEQNREIEDQRRRIEEQNQELGRMRVALDDLRRTLAAGSGSTK